MEPALRALPAIPQRAASCPLTATGDDDEEALKCRLLLASGDPLKRGGSDGADAANSGDSVAAESVASESDASNALNGHSQVSDGDSQAPGGDDHDADAAHHLKRCPSGGSIVTYDEAASKLREAGTCERTGNRKPARRADSSSAGDCPGTSINAGQEMAESAGPAWTEDKHCSYLNSIEQTFVNSLYGQDFRTVDGPGQDDQDCVESRPMYGSSSYGDELFTSLQRGCYGQREYYRPHFLHKFAPATSSIFRSPWIQHFSPKSAAAGSHGGAANAGPEPEAGAHPPSGCAEGETSAAAAAAAADENKDANEEVMESFPDLPDAGAQARSSRYFASSSGPARANVGLQAKKRPCTAPDEEALYRPKKLKPTQRLQAEIDLEMEEQFVLKQKHLGRSHSKGDSRLRGCILDLNKAAVEEDEDVGTNVDASPAVPEGVSKGADFIITSFDETVGARSEGGIKPTADLLR